MTARNPLIAAAAGVLLAAFAMHWLWFGGSHMDVEGLSQRLLLATDQVWSHLHGWASESDCQAATEKAGKAEDATPGRIFGAYARPENLKYLTSQEGNSLALAQRLNNASDTICGENHISEFGRFYARLAELVCPLAGFALFLILARPKPIWRLWIPVAILAATLLLPHWHSWELIAQAAFVALAMISSMALFPDAKRREDAI
jgi:hypothetical protein